MATLWRLLTLLLLPAHRVWTLQPLVHPRTLPLLPHNLTACLQHAAARPAGGPLRSLCLAFDTFNRSACTHGPVACLNASGCLPLYGVPACVGDGGFNLSRATFNKSVCADLVTSLNLTDSLGNGTGCDALSYDAERAGNATAANTTNTTNATEVFALPRFHPCEVAFDQTRLRRLDVLALSRPFVSYMVVGVSPTFGPVTGGATIAVCGIGFKLTNDNINHLKCRFSDGYNTLVEPAIYEDGFTLRCRTPDFSRFRRAWCLWSMWGGGRGLGGQEKEGQ